MRGLTIIELIIVILLLSVLVVIGTMVLPSVSLYQSKNIADNFIYDLNLTRVLSLCTNQRYRLAIGASSYQIQNQNGVGITHPETGNQAINYPAGTTISPVTTIIFDALGAPYDSNNQALTANQVFTITSSGATQTVTITPQTGWIQ